MPANDNGTALRGWGRTGQPAYWTRSMVLVRLRMDVQQNPDGTWLAFMEGHRLNARYPTARDAMTAAEFAAHERLQKAIIELNENR